VFARPDYENGVASITDSDMRSLPDLTMDAQDGTSEAAPLLAGVLALATQMNDANVGPINTVLYDVLGPAGSADGISDVISGNESAETPDGTVTVQGYTARRDSTSRVDGAPSMRRRSFRASSQRHRPPTKTRRSANRLRPS
jgi:hypothetical protein